MDKDTAKCIHIRNRFCDSDVCVRGTSHEPYAELAAEANGQKALAQNKTISYQRYGERMTVRPASKCTDQTEPKPDA